MGREEKSRKVGKVLTLMRQFQLSWKRAIYQHPVSTTPGLRIHGGLGVGPEQVDLLVSWQSGCLDLNEVETSIPVLRWNECFRSTGGATGNR